MNAGPPRETFALTDLLSQTTPCRQTKSGLPPCLRMPSKTLLDLSSSLYYQFGTPHYYPSS